MTRIVAWFARNPVAANLLTAFFIVAGLVALPHIKREVFPEFDSNWVLVQVPYPGAAPEETEGSICARVEEVVLSIEGVKQVVSTAAESAGIVAIELFPNTDTQRALNEIKTRVDSIDTFPAETEKPVVTEIIVRKQVINVAISGDVTERELKRAGERVRDELLALPGITQVELAHMRPYEVAIELSEDRMREYGLTFDEVAAAVRQGSLDLPGGTLRTRAGEVLLRSKTQAQTGAEFERLPLRTHADGSRLTLGQVATVVDGFAETDLRSRFDGRPAVLVRVFRVGDQSALEISREVKDYVAGAASRLPPGIKLGTWQDDSNYLRSRIGFLLRDGWQGLLLVFLSLALFLRFRVACWVTFGIPVAFLAMLWLMPMMDVSISLITLFAFIVVLGILVDDAIVFGENIYTHQQRHGPGLESTISGAMEVAVPVVFGVLTTVAAFVPLLFLEGNTGKVLRYIPLIVVPMLLISLVECVCCLPAHLRNMPDTRSVQGRRGPGGLWARFQSWFADGAERWIVRGYEPLLNACLRWRYLTLATGVGVFLITLAAFAGGHFRFVFFPNVEGDNVAAWVTFPRGTSVETTQAAVARLERAADTVRRDVVAQGLDTTNVFEHSLATVGFQPFRTDAERAGGNYGSDHSGGHKGEVHIETAPSEARRISSFELAARWREAAGEIPGALEQGFSSSIFSAGKPINIRLSGPDLPTLQRAATDLKRRLSAYPEAQNIADTFQPGKREIQIRLSPDAEILGLREADLARQVRQAFYGEEAQRLQRNRDDVRVMVRYPQEQRRSTYDLEDMHVRLPDGRSVPLTEVASLTSGRGYATIRRVDGRRSVSVTADVDTSKLEPDALLARLEQKDLPELMAAHSGLQYSLEGARQEQELTLGSMKRGYIMAIVMIYALLAIPLQSYLQPLIVMSAIPLGLIGAVLGHLILGMDLTVLSLFGMVALTGVTVNDSLVMVDFVNRNRQRYPTLIEAVRVSGVARFRAIMLNSLTTFVGVAPLVFFEKSVQAKFLVPMAVSLGFGIMFATVVTLLLVPSIYLIQEDLRRAVKWLYGGGEAAPVEPPAAVLQAPPGNPSQAPAQ